MPEKVTVRIPPGAMPGALVTIREDGGDLRVLSILEKRIDGSGAVELELQDEAWPPVPQNPRPAPTPPRSVASTPPPPHGVLRLEAVEHAGQIMHSPADCQVCSRLSDYATAP